LLVIFAETTWKSTPPEQNRDTSPEVQNGDVVLSKVQPVPHTPFAVVPKPLPSLETPPVDSYPPIAIFPPVDGVPPMVDVPPVPVSAQQPPLQIRLPCKVPSEHGQQPHASLQPVLQSGGWAHPAMAQLTLCVSPVLVAIADAPPLAGRVPPRPKELTEEVAPPRLKVLPVECAPPAFVVARVPPACAGSLLTLPEQAVSKKQKAPRPEQAKFIMISVNFARPCFRAQD
jgi:hypothetical protein